MSTSSIDARTRASALERLATQRYDLIVVGGGVTGAGVALDAAARGLRTALVERVDLAAGTSRWSSKLVHGGLRYLATGDVRIAYESARERHHLMTAIAPHLVAPLLNVVPDTGFVATRASAIGIRLADGLRRAAGTPADLLAPPRRLSAGQVRAAFPGAAARLRGIGYQDGQLVDDARLVVTLSRTAAAHGADVVTRCAARPLDADRVELTDLLTGATCVASGHVVLATGVWSAQHEPGLQVTPSRGSHLVLPADRLGRPTAQLSAPVPGHFGRYVFAVPILDDLVIVGLTDEAAPDADGIAPPVPESDERFLLETMSAVLDGPALTSADVVGRFAGLRPLVQLSGTAAAQSTAAASRDHVLIDVPDRPVTITGGKLTTYRRMAQDAVDAVVRRLDDPAAVAPCRTARLPLLGAAPRDALGSVTAAPRLVRRYGTVATEVAGLADAHPWLAEPVADGCPTLAAEFAHGVLHEGALTPQDLVERRTRVSFVDAHVEQALRTAERVLAEFGTGAAGHAGAAPA